MASLSGGQPAERTAVCADSTPCTNPGCLCGGYWAFVVKDDKGNTISSSIDFSLPCVNCMHGREEHKPAGANALAAIPHCPPTGPCREAGCICKFFNFLARAHGDILPRYQCQCKHAYGNHFHLEPVTPATSENQSTSASASASSSSVGRTFGESLHVSQGSTNSRRMESAANHRPQHGAGGSGGGAVARRTGQRVPAVGRVPSAGRGGGRSSLPYAHNGGRDDEPVMRGPGRPPLPRKLKGLIMFFPMDISSPIVDWCADAPYPSNEDIEVYTSRFVLDHADLPALAKRMKQFHLAFEFEFDYDECKKGSLFNSFVRRAQEYFNSKGIQLFTTSPTALSHDTFHVQMLSFANTRSRKLAFRALSRLPTDVVVNDIKKLSIPNDPDAYYIPMCPRGASLYLVSSISHMPSSPHDSVHIMHDSLHHCFNVVSFDGMQDLNLRAIPVVPGRCKSICSFMPSMLPVASFDSLTVPIYDSRITFPADNVQTSSSSFANAVSNDFDIEMDLSRSRTPAVEFPGSYFGSRLPTPPRLPDLPVQPMAQFFAPESAAPPPSPAPSRATQDTQNLVTGVHHSQVVHPSPASTPWQPLRQFDEQLWHSASPAAASGSHQRHSPPLAAPVPRRQWPPTVSDVGLRVFHDERLHAPGSSRAHSSLRQVAAAPSISSQPTAVPDPAPALVPAVRLNNVQGGSAGQPDYPFGGAALLNSIATQTASTATQRPRFDMTLPPSSAAGSPASDGESDRHSGDGQRSAHSSDMSTSSDEFDDSESEGDGDVDNDDLNNAHAATRLPSVNPSDWRTPLLHFRFRLLDTIPTGTKHLLFSYYSGSELGPDVDHDLSVVVSFVFKLLVDRSDRPRSASNVARNVTQKFPGGHVEVSNFTLRTLFSSATSEFHLGTAVGDGVRDTVIATLMDTLLKEPHWRSVGRYKIPFLEPYGVPSSDAITNIKTTSLGLTYGIVATQLIIGVHPAFVLLIAVAKFLHVQLTDPTALSVLVDKALVQVVDPDSYPAVCVFPDAHDKPLPAFDAHNPAVVSLYGHLAEAGISCVPAVRPRSMHWSLKLALYSKILTGVNLVASPVPRGWEDFAAILNTDLSFGDDPLLPSPLTQLFVSPLGHRGTMADEIVNMKRLILGMAVVPATRANLSPRFRFLAPDAATPADHELVASFKKLFLRYLARPGHPAPALNFLTVPPAALSPEQAVHVRAVLFARTLTGHDTVPIPPAGASESPSLRIAFQFTLVDDPPAHIAAPLPSPLRFHMCSHDIDVHVNAPFRHMIARSEASVEHALQTAGNDHNLDTEFDIFIHPQLANPRASFSMV